MRSEWTNGRRFTITAGDYCNAVYRRKLLFDKKIDELGATNFAALLFSEAAFHHVLGCISICDLEVKSRLAGPRNEQPNASAKVRQVFDANPET